MSVQHLKCLDTVSEIGSTWLPKLETFPILEMCRHSFRDCKHIASEIGNVSNIGNGHSFQDRKHITSEIGNASNLGNVQTQFSISKAHGFQNWKRFQLKRLDTVSDIGST
jgi:hypothetical protein